MVDIKYLQSLNDVFTNVMKRIFLTPASSNETQNEITWAQQKIMILLAEDGPMKMSDIARNISVTMSGATAIIERMVKAGLVQREADPQDRRVIRITMSDQGKQFICNCMETQAQCFAEILDQLEPAKQKELLSAFERIHTLLAEIESTRQQAALGAEESGSHRLANVSKLNKGTINSGVFGFLLAGALILTGCNRNGEAKAELGVPADKSKPQVVAKEQVPTVEVEQVSRAQTVQMAGSLAADENSDVASKRGGIIREVKVERGSIVRTGDPLLVLDATDVKNRLAEGRAETAELAVRLGLKQDTTSFSVEQQPDVRGAKARLDLAEANFRRDSELYEKKVIARGEYDTSRNNYDTARQAYQSSVQQAAQLYQTYLTSLARLNTIRQSVEDMMVRAPFDGMIAEKHVAVGESLQDGAKVVTLVRIDPLRLVLTIPEQQVGLVQEGQTVNFRVGALPDQQFQGKVRHIGPTLQSTDRTLLVEAIVPNKEHKLRPGYFAQAELVSAETATAMMVPEKAIKREGESARVYVLQEGRAHEQVVTLGKAEQDRVEVTSGLTGGETVVAEAARVQDGVLVR